MLSSGGITAQLVSIATQITRFTCKNLKEASEKYLVKVHAFVLMTNHVHLLVTPSDTEGVPRMMQSLGRCYVRYVNIAYQRTGTLWEGRYKSCLVASDEYLLAVSRYIELNPVRAGMVKLPSEYPCQATGTMPWESRSV